MNEVLDDAMREEATASYLAAVEAALDGTGWVVTPAGPSGWIHAAPADGVVLPGQGWKLHVSATVRTAPRVIEIVAATLCAADAPSSSFKVAAGAPQLAQLNQGDGGGSQIGKFVTVYPIDEAAAVELARRLDIACAGLTGPIVPSDLRLRPDGIVSYRYGGFRGRWMQLPHGEMVTAIERPDGSLVADLRTRAGAVPDWAVDPFQAAGLVEPEPPVPDLVADRYRIVATLHRSPRGGVHLAVDLHDLRRCVLKRAIVDDGPGGASARLAQERANLAALGHVDGLVRVLDAFRRDGEDVLVLEDIDGTTMYEMAGRPEEGFRLAPGEVVRIGIELADIVGEIHAAGYVHRDVKPANVLVERGGRVRLIDLESAGRRGEPRAMLMGTPGYAPPRQLAGGVPETTDDVYSLGASLLVIAAGTEPGSMPLGGLLRRPLDELAPSLPAALRAVIERCLAPEEGDRYPDGHAVAAALRSLGPTGEVRVPYGAMPATPAPDHALAHARALADALVADAIETEHGLAWMSRHPASPGIVVRDVNTGVAGTIIGLAAVDHVLDGHPHTDVIEHAADHLVRAPRPEGPLCTGLFVGEAGAAVALARAAVATGRTRFLDAALACSRRVAALDHGGIDLFNGIAGRARMHLALATLTGDEGEWAALREAVGVLTRAAVQPAPGHAAWALEAAGGLALGYAHGAAGIADVLLDVHEATGDEPAFELALAVGRWLVAQARPCGDGLVAWPSVAGGRSAAPLWCHGAVGIARFLLHLDRLGALEDEARWLPGAAGAAAARIGRGLGPVLCHGLAGSIDLLIDLHLHGGGGAASAHLTEAWSLAGLLEGYHLVDAAGVERCSAETPHICSPDLTVGYAGVAALWARLADPVRSPAVLDLTAFATVTR